MKKKGDIKIPNKIKEKVKILYAEGYSNYYIGNRLKISDDSVKTILGKEDNLEIFRDKKKREMAESLWDLAIRMKNKITDEKLTKTAASSLVIGLATAIDKALLLLGEATNRFEVKTEAELNRELKELEAAEKELKKAWKRAMKNRKKAAEEQGGDNNEN